jgi:hypothetical protein
MSVEYDASGGAMKTLDLTHGFSIPASTMTMACRFKLDATQTDTVITIMMLNEAATNFGNAVRLQVNSSGNLLLQYRTTAGNGALLMPNQNPCTTGVWHSYIVKFVSDTQLSAWTDGVNERLNHTLSASADVSTITAAELMIGGRDGAAQDLDGFVADVCVWDGRLSDDQCIAYSNGADPLMLNPGDLKIYVPHRNTILEDRMQTATLSHSVAAASVAESDNPATIFPE